MTARRGQGAVAAGSPLTVEAGLTALRLGGNAVDAAVAATLMAAVAEPLLTGLGGGGMALVRMNGEVQAWDFFADMPGRGRGPGEPPPMTSVEVDFGPTTQVFHAGPASVAVPGMTRGLFALHDAHGRVPMEDLARPAIRAAHEGVEVSPGFERVCALLWPILRLSPESAQMFGPRGSPLVAGDRYRCPDLGETMARLVAEGPDLFVDGDVGRGVVELLGNRSLLTSADLAAYRAHAIPALPYRYRDATVWVPGPPSVAGLLVLQALRALEDHGPMPVPLSAAQVRFLAHAMERAETARRGVFLRELFTPGFVEGFLSAIAPEETGEEVAHAPLKVPRKPGHTTHISAVDAAGNAVGITHSLGETCGLVVPGTGLLLNNFLGEEDVNPPRHPRAPGERLMTMCCPTILEVGQDVYVMGSGGSSRIRSAILHGVVYLTDHGMTPEQVVAAPRSHVEAGLLLAESAGRPEGAMDALAVGYPGMKRFDGPNMFFGGLHVAGINAEGFCGAGDRRRSGSFGRT